MRGWLKNLMLWCLILGIPVGVLAGVALLARVPPTEWVDARTQGQRVGDALVRITAVQVGRPTGEGIGTKLTAKVDYLLITFRVSNGGSGLVRYNRWKPAVALGASGVTLTDERGRHYKMILTNLGETLEGEYGGSGELKPGEHLDDLLVFETPTAGAGELSLELPAGNVGEVSKKIGFRIPVGMIGSGIVSEKEAPKRR